MANGHEEDLESLLDDPVNDPKIARAPGAQALEGKLQWLPTLGFRGEKLEAPADSPSDLGI